MNTLVLVALGLSLSASPEPVQAKKFDVDVSGTTTALKVGHKGKVSVQIQPVAGYKVNDKGPLAVALSAQSHIALEKAKLLRKDAKGSKRSPEFSCGFNAQTAGEDQIDIQLTFVLCDDAGTVCEMKKEKVTVAVVVDS